MGLKIFGLRRRFIKRRTRTKYDWHGVKRWYTRDLKSGADMVALTPWAAKERKRRRAARKVAHESRRRNRV